MDIKNGAAGKLPEYLFKPGNPHPSELLRYPAADIQPPELLPGHVLNPACTVRYPLHPVIVADQLAVGRGIEIEFNLGSAQGHRRPKGRQRIFGQPAVQAPVGTDPGIGQTAVAGDDAGTGRPVGPGCPARLYIKVVPDIGLTVSIGTAIFPVRIDLGTLPSDPAFHIAKNRPVRCHYH